MIQPVNNHLLIQPLKHDSFIASQKETYEEIGEVLAIDDSINIGAIKYQDGVTTSTPLYYTTESPKVSVGDKVYFDAWLAAKFPSGVDDEFYWLVKWEDIRAVEYAKKKSVSE